MTQDQIIEMARQVASHGVEDHRSGEVSYVFYNEHLGNFAKLVAAAEREACAEILDANAMACNSPIMRSLLQSNAQAIRARGQS
jgi:hypothetical protein